MSAEGVDYSYARPSPSGLVAAGKRFVVRYGGPGKPGKLITVAEARTLLDAGLSIVANAEGDKGGLALGRSAGVAWAAAAMPLFMACGMPANRPIYFSCDFDVTAAQWPAVADALRGCAEVLGAARVGIYGGRNAILWAHRDQVADWFWQTYAWSTVDGRTAWVPGNHIEQYRNDVTVAGGACDLDRALVVDYGQWGQPHDPDGKDDSVSNPEFSGVEWFGPCPAGHGNYAHRYLVWHCTDNAQSTALSEAQFAFGRQDGIGTHFTADESRAIQTLETFRAVGHVGSTVGNLYGIALEMCGTEVSSAGHYRRVTDAAMPAIRKACAKWGIPARWLTNAQANDGVSRGWLTHDDARRFWGGTDHVDPGPNFDRQYALDSFNQAPTPPAPAPTTTLGDTDMIFTVTGVPAGQLDHTGFACVNGGQYLLTKVTDDGRCGFNLSGNEFFSLPDSAEPVRMAMTWPRFVALCAGQTADEVDMDALATLIASKYSADQVTADAVRGAWSSPEGHAAFNQLLQDPAVQASLAQSVEYAEDH
jgi:hypothetical protein